MSLGRVLGYAFRKNVRFPLQTYQTFSLKDYKSHSSRKHYFDFISSLDPDNAKRTENLKITFEKICYDLTKENNSIVLKAVSDRLGMVLHYNVLGGKMLRSQLVIAAFIALSPKPNLTKGLDHIILLAFCVELLQAFLIICDDILDNGSMRRGKPCWFRLPDIGIQGLNDALLLECSMYQLMSHHFSDQKWYMKIVDEFLRITRATIWGQSLDLGANSTHKPKLELFNYDNYYNIVEYKTAYYTFCLPVFLAMHVVGGFSERDFEDVKMICMKMGRYFQVQDDYLDLYGDYRETGKTGTDIQEGKCSWFAVTALENSSDIEKKIMEENYGVKDQSATEKVLQLYNTLLLKEKYFGFEEQLSSEIDCLIQELDAKKTLNIEIFSLMLTFLHKRNK